MIVIWFMGLFGRKAPPEPPRRSSRPWATLHALKLGEDAEQYLLRALQLLLEHERATKGVQHAVADLVNELHGERPELRLLQGGQDA